jgi:hypothetical protein
MLSACISYAGTLLSSPKSCEEMEPINTRSIFLTYQCYADKCPSFNNRFARMDSSEIAKLPY